MAWKEAYMAGIPLPPTTHLEHGSGGHSRETSPGRPGEAPR